MASNDYPYATLEKDGFQLAVVEQGEVMRPLSVPLPADDARFAVKAGDLVKVIFEYREAMKASGSGAEYDAEHMWVKVVGWSETCVSGELDSSPQFTTLLKSGDPIAFHPKHIIAFWRE